MKTLLISLASIIAVFILIPILFYCLSKLGYLLGEIAARYVNFLLNYFDSTSVAIIFSICIILVISIIATAIVTKTDCIGNAQDF